MQVCTLLHTDNHASTPPLSFLQDGCPSCRPTNSVKALHLKPKKNLPKKFIYSHTTASKSKTKELTVSGLQQ